MSEHAFQSRLSEYLDSFVRQKHDAGFEYISAIGKLHMFDAMIAEHFPEEDTVTKAVAEAWMEKRKIYPRTILNDINVVRQFAIYLNSIGINAYVIPKKSFRIPSRYEPHIFNSQEKTAFFKALDRCQWTAGSPTKCYVAPMIFRMLYCCGLRSSEAILLRCDDVELETGKVTIKASKRWRQRIIYVSWDLLHDLRNYDGLIDQVCPERVAFFPNRRGSFFCRGILNEWFHEFWDPLPEASVITGNPPRVHDWRHTFFTDRLNKWVQENEDINVLSPYLSEYGGHIRYAMDDYYEHLTSSFYPEMKKRMSDINKAILPEVTR